ncbi:MAG: aminopeptidase P family N-terminal domain-containing protein [Desulfobacterales bacterium]
MKTKVAARIERLREKMTRQKIDTFLVLIQENRRYLSGYTGEDTQFDESAGALIISQKSLALATDSDLNSRPSRSPPL